MKSENRQNRSHYHLSDQFGLGWNIFYVIGKPQQEDGSTACGHRQKGIDPSRILPRKDRNRLPGKHRAQKNAHSAEQAHRMLVPPVISRMTYKLMPDGKPSHHGGQYKRQGECEEKSDQVYQGVGDHLNYR